MIATRRAGRARQFDHVRHQFSRVRRPIAGAATGAAESEQAGDCAREGRVDFRKAMADTSTVRCGEPVKPALSGRAGTYFEAGSGFHMGFI
jgi:hypothetical protein